MSTLFSSEATSLEYTRLSVSLNILFCYNLLLRNCEQIVTETSKNNLILS
jgi:hypothetical protein